MHRKPLNVRVAGLRQLTPAIREYVLQSADGAPLPQTSAGAHIELHLTPVSGAPIVRHYSLIGGVGSWDDPPDCYRIAVRREATGVGSVYVHETFNLGTGLVISEPRNELPMVPLSPHTVLIAGGIGITPIYAMVRKLVRTSREFRLHYAGREWGQMAYAEDLRRLAADRVEFHIDGGDLARGLNIRSVLAGHPSDTHVYVCGPPGMIAATREAACVAGMPPEHVHSELFDNSALVGNAESFTVVLKQSGIVARVGPRETILAALETAGYPAIFDCRRGECGICTLPILEADGPIDHRDRFLPEKDRAAAHTLCICVSRLKGTRLVLDA